MTNTGSSAGDVASPQMKHCPICDADLPLADFGICRARKDGRNLYCMACVRRKTNEMRRHNKIYIAERKRRAQEKLRADFTQPFTLPPEPEPAPSVPFEKLEPVSRVRAAITQQGPCTYKDIVRRTKLPKDAVGEALTNLLLWTKEVRTQTVGGVRVYFASDYRFSARRGRVEREQARGVEGSRSSRVA